MQAFISNMREENNYFKEPRRLSFTVDSVFNFDSPNDFSSNFNDGKLRTCLGSVYPKHYIENMHSFTIPENQINLSNDNSELKLSTNDFAPNDALIYKSEDWVSMNALHSQNGCSLINNVQSAPSTSNYKREFAQRKDVVYKTLLRNTRRYLFHLLLTFSPEAKFSTYTRGCLVFESWINQLYHKYFEAHAKSVFSENAEEWEHFRQLLAIFASGDIVVTQRTSNAKKIGLELRRALKQFNSKGYKRFFKMKGVDTFFKILKVSSVFYEMINFYSSMKFIEEKNCLNSSNGSETESNVYWKALKTIIDFKTTPELLK